MPKPASDPVLDYLLSEDYEDDTSTTTPSRTTNNTDLIRIGDLNLTADMEASGDMIQDSSCLTLIIVTVSGLLLILGLVLTVCYCRQIIMLIKLIKLIN